MSHHLKKAMLALAAALWLTACSKEPQAASLPFTTVAAEKEVALTADKDAPTCKVSLNVASAKSGNAETDRAINEAVVQKLFDMQQLTVQQATDSFAYRYTREYKTNLAPLYAHDKDDAEKRQWYEYHYTITTHTQAGRDGAVVYIADVDYYEGGAHGISQQLVMNFDANTGEQLTLSKLFVPGAETRLAELLLNRLMDMQEVSSLEALRAKDFLYAMDMFPTDNFVLGTDDITFIYNVYEIAPYAAGRTEISLSYSDVRDLMKK